MAEYLMTDVHINELIPIYQARYGQDNIPYYLIDANGGLIDCNSAFLQLIGRTPETVIHHTLEDLNIRCVDSPNQKKTRQVFKKEGMLTIRRRMLIVTTNKSMIVTSIEQVVVSPASKIIGYVGHLEIPVRLGNDPLTVSGMVNNHHPSIEPSNGSSNHATDPTWNSELRHDLKNGFSNLKILSFLLQRNITPDGQKYIDRLEAQINRIQEMLLAANFQENNAPPEPRMQNLHHVLQDVIAVNIDTAQAKNVDVVYLNANENIGLNLDRNDLYRLFSNLVSNAIKYTHIGEVIVVVRFDEATSRAEIQITDTGIGIPHIDQTHIFDSHFRSSNAVDSAIEGSGIGLSIVKRIVTNAGGTIAVNSQLNVGTTFTITLPCQVMASI